MSIETLDSPPSSASLYVKAALGMTPLVRGRGKDVPQRILQLENISIEPAKLADYCRVTEFTMRDTLPPVYPNTLAFPLHMKLLTAGDFPFPAIGLVHVENTITQHRPVKTSEPITLAVRGTPLEAHAKGRQFTVITEVTVGDELVQVAESTYLKRGGGDKDKASQRPEGAAAPDELPRIAEWKLPGDLGRRYASVSGDRNPIHMHDLTAKAFGFPRAIAHGMWTKARCLAALDNRRPDAFKVHVAFRKPILLPAKVALAAAEHGDDGLDFAVRGVKKDTPHLDGTLRAV